MGNIIIEVNSIFSCMYPFIYNELQKSASLYSVKTDKTISSVMHPHTIQTIDEYRNNLYSIVRDAYTSSSILWDKYKIPMEIRKHSLKVGILAFFLFFIRKNRNSFYINTIKSDMFYSVLYKIVRSGFLHDIAKVNEITNDKNHAEYGYQLLLKEHLNFEALACKNHLIRSFSQSLPEPFKLLNAADKCVIHSTYATIKERMIDLDKRYPHHKTMFSDQNIKKYEDYLSLFDQGVLNSFFSACNKL